MMRTPTDRHHGYPGRLPRNRIQDLYTKHDHGERKIFKIEYLERIDLSLEEKIFRPTR